MFSKFEDVNLGKLFLQTISKYLMIILLIFLTIYFYSPHGCYSVKLGKLNNFNVVFHYLTD